MIKPLLLALAAVLVIVAPHVAAVAVTGAAGLAVWAGAQPAVLAALIGYAARPHLARIVRR